MMTSTVHEEFHSILGADTTWSWDLPSKRGKETQKHGFAIQVGHWTNNTQWPSTVNTVKGHPVQICATAIAPPDKPFACHRQPKYTATNVLESNYALQAVPTLCYYFQPLTCPIAMPYLHTLHGKPPESLSWVATSNFLHVDFNTWSLNSGATCATSQVHGCIFRSVSDITIHRTFAKPISSYSPWRKAVLLLGQDKTLLGYISSLQIFNMTFIHFGALGSSTNPIYVNASAL